MRKLILCGEEWFEMRFAEFSERYANLAKRNRERTENCKRRIELVESAERLPETKEETNG